MLGVLGRGQEAQAQETGGTPGPEEELAEDWEGSHQGRREEGSGAGPSPVRALSLDHC